MEVVFCESAKAKTALFKTFNSMRENGEFLDITLIIEGKRFKAHKLILVACSDFFHVMFTGSMVESRQDEITLYEIKVAVFDQILEYFYTSKILLDGSNIQDILETASYLLAESLSQTCLEYLLSQIHIRNCLSIATLGEIINQRKLKTEAYKFMLEKLVQFSLSTEFYDLTPKQFEDIITQDIFVSFDEAVFFKLVLAWFFNVYCPSDNFDTLDAKLFAKRIIKHIRFNEISRKEFYTIIRELFQNTNAEGEFYKEMLLKAYSNKSSLNPRGMKLAILKVGGVHETQNYEISYCFPEESKWKFLTSVPKLSPYWDYEETFVYPSVLNNELYVLRSSADVNFGCKYSPRRGQWKWIAPMTITGRCFFSLNALGNRLYVVGGSEQDDDGGFTQNLRYSERYDPVSNKWYMIKPFPVPIAHHAGAGYDSNADLKLFISGGRTRGVVSSSMYSYTESENEWHQCAPMPRGRMNHQLISIGDFLYVCGGSLDNDTLASTIDVYDVKNDSWKFVTEVPTPREFESVVCVNRKIYFLGGYTLDTSGAYESMTSIKSYDIDSHLWTVEKDSDYPHKIAEHDCVPLFVPKI